MPGVKRACFSGVWDKGTVTNPELQLSLYNLLKIILRGCPGTCLDSGLLDSVQDMVESIWAWLFGGCRSLLCPCDDIFPISWDDMFKQPLFLFGVEGIFWRCLRPGFPVFYWVISEGLSLPQSTELGTGLTHYPQPYESTYSGSDTSDSCL
jgi:hypothetical protein